MSEMVVETVVTTVDARGEPHFAAMGVVWGEEVITIRPYANTRTLRNLRGRGEAVVNVTDDVLTFAKSALTHERMACGPAAHVTGVILESACHWREVRVRKIVMAPLAATSARADVITDVVAAGRRREFPGLCRAKHAVVEASILASRIKFLPLTEILDQMQRLDPVVDKTGGPREREAFEFIRSYIAERAAARECAR